MCGRFANSENIPVIAARWSASVAGGAEAWEPDADIRPTRRVPVLLEGPAERPRRIGLMTWGWARDFASSGRLINARAEGIAAKRTFAEAVQRRRCLVPATAWFEWQKTEPGARGGMKHHVQPDVLQTWAIAGLWEAGPDGASVVLLTTAAHPSIAAVHDRMPVIIPSEQGSRWLCAGADDALGLAVAIASSAQPA